MDSPAIGGVDASVVRKENVESGQVVSKEEEIGEDTTASEECATPVDMNGNEVPVVVEVVVVIFIRESSVDLGRIKVGEADVAGILLYADIFVELEGDVDFDTSTMEDVTTLGALDTVVREEPDGRLDKIQVSIGEMVILEMRGGFGGSVVPGITYVAVFSNVCLISDQLVVIALKDVNEGLSEIPKV
ncbi:hypothetical protein H920_01318 [Fukomys damarensis]|uniref:Uncharacterized protein n=1 Tax=Fukomys damarensis TaxID=885580 RepID=A0A091E1T4_FUKDA|nr:hypothetical protein H920_01318 [Fukomys damarensis]